MSWNPQGTDPGNPDPCLLVVEPEFISVLKATGRDINTLSPVLRAAWDGWPFAVVTRSAPLRATAAHIAVIGHITGAELAAHTHAVEAANGFLNRFCFFAVRGHRLLPDGGERDPLSGTTMAERLATNLTWARRAGALSMDIAARAKWHDIYVRLSEAPEGLLGLTLLRITEIPHLRSPNVPRRSSGVEGLI